MRWFFCLFEKYDYFTNRFLQQCKRNSHIPQFLTRENNNTRREIALGGGLYSQVVVIRLYILKTKATKETLVKDKENNNNSYMNYQIEDGNYNNCDPVRDKIKKGTSEVTYEKKGGRSPEWSELTYKFQGQYSISQQWFNLDTE